jgi:hypothetical protein
MGRMAEIAGAIEDLYEDGKDALTIAEELNLPFSMVDDYVHQLKLELIQGEFEQRLAEGLHKELGAGWRLMVHE